MNFLLIPDKFKNSLSAEKVIQALSKGIGKALPGATIYSIPASDGGDGFLEAIEKNGSLKREKVITVDPLGRKLTTYYLFDATTKSAYIELAKASGIQLLKQSELNVMKTSTFGTGTVIKRALEKGASSIYIGLGGSATNDAGLGIASALGYRFLDQAGNPVFPSGADLSKIKEVDVSTLSLNLVKVSFYAINDVTNPLYGKKGAAYGYAQQKGANRREIEMLDRGLRDVDDLIRSKLGKDMAHLPGAGAAGGAAYGLAVFCGAKFIKGTDFIFKISQVETLLKKGHINYLVTGEGKIDAQTLDGKLIKGVMELGLRYGIPVLAVCGKLELEGSLLKQSGLRDVLEIYDSGKPLQYSMDNAPQLIETAIFEYLKRNRNPNKTTPL
jgi:glycerate kinase